MTTDITLLPRPRTLTRREGALTLADRRLIALAVPEASALLFSARRFQEALARYTHLNWEIVGGAAVPADDIGLLIAFDNSISHPEGYHLIVAPEGITLAARDRAGVFYGICTLIQLVQQFGAALPALVIDDYPDLPNRGIMLDISRDKVPTMETLYALVDRLASWKINQLQLYTEHTFAYRRHPEVWAKASPMTAEQILALDAFCRDRCIDLVPNQNSFGHMHRWFAHARYMPLAETEGGAMAPWGDPLPYPYSLTPVNPDSLTFLEELYDELLPNFTSQYFNVGCDETFDLGQGRSKSACEVKGIGRVYLEFLLEIYERVRARGKTMQFWGDIIASYPELVAEIPRDTIALEWWYEASAEFDAARRQSPGTDWQDEASRVDKKCAAYAASGIPFYVCPGTSAWTTIAGRTDNAIGNISEVVSNGLKYGAIGVLTTDWGDFGHWQTLPVSFLGYAYGAACGWAYEANAGIDLPAVLDAFAFEDSAGVMGRLAYDLGNTYQQTGIRISNSSIFHLAYQLPLDLMTAEVKGSLARNRQRLQQVDDLPGKLRDALAYIDGVMRPLDGAKMARPDAALIDEEFRLSADMLRHGAKRLLMIAGDGSIRCEDMREELLAIEARYKAQWLKRNRPGGLEDSVGRISAAREAYG